MHKRLRRILEVLVSTVIVSVTTVLLNWVFEIIRNWDGQPGVGGLPYALFGGVVFGFVVFGVYIIPSAFLVSLAIASLNRWSLRAVTVLLLVVMICSSASSYIIDPTSSRAYYGSTGYFARLDWFTSEFNLAAVITGSIASLTAFWAVLRSRRCHANVT
jgi:hypothetical protein